MHACVLGKRWKTEGGGGGSQSMQAEIKCARPEALSFVLCVCLCEAYLSDMKVPVKRCGVSEDSGKWSHQGLPFFGHVAKHGG